MISFFFCVAALCPLRLVCCRFSCRCRILYSGGLFLGAAGDICCARLSLCLRAAPQKDKKKASDHDAFSAAQAAMVSAYMAQMLSKIKIKGKMVSQKTNHLVLVKNSVENFNS